MKPPVGYQKPEVITLAAQELMERIGPALGGQSVFAVGFAPSRGQQNLSEGKLTR